MADKAFMDSLRTGQLVEDGDQPWQWYSSSEYAVKPRAKAKVDHREQACAALRRLARRSPGERFSARIAANNPDLLNLTPEAIKVYTILAKGFDTEKKSASNAKSYREQVFETVEQRAARKVERARQAIPWRAQNRDRIVAQQRLKRANRTASEIERDRVRNKNYERSDEGKAKDTRTKRLSRAKWTKEEVSIVNAKRWARKKRRNAYLKQLIADASKDGDWQLHPLNYTPRFG